MRALAWIVLVVTAFVTACGAPAAGREARAESAAPEPSRRALLERAERAAEAAEEACGAVDDQRGRAPREVEDECPDYDPAIDALVSLMQAHPDSVEATAALEPLGFFLHRMGRTEQARAALAAVCSEHVRDPLVTPAHAPTEGELERCEPRPMSPLRTFLVWLRLGELYFDEPDLERARAALARAVAIAPGDRRYADPARYKLAWTLYRLDRFAEAVGTFAPLASSPDGPLRAEAMQYMAIILAEPDWDVDGHDDPAWGLERPQARAWLEWADAPALVLAIAGVLLDDARYPQAIATCEVFLARWPGDPRATDARALLERARARCEAGAQARGPSGAGRCIVGR